MDALSAFGLFAVTAMLVTYAFEERHYGFILAFAGSCALGSAYGFPARGVAFRLGRSSVGIGRGAPLVVGMSGSDHNRSPLKVMTPRAANTIAATVRIALTDSLSASLSPISTTGMFAATMPSVVPTTTA